jgi:hypothetical protein
MSTSAIRHVDSDGRVSLGSRWAGRRVMVTFQDDTMILVEVAEHASDTPECLHAHITTRAADEIFHERRGCLDCNQWLEPERLKNP